MYVVQARKLYARIFPEDKDLKFFKKGAIKFTRTGTVEYWFHGLIRRWSVYYSTILKDPRELILECGGFLQNPNILSSFIQNHAKKATKQLSTQLKFMVAIEEIN